MLKNNQGGSLKNHPMQYKISCQGCNYLSKPLSFSFLEVQLFCVAMYPVDLHSVIINNQLKTINMKESKHTYYKIRCQ